MIAFTRRHQRKNLPKYSTSRRQGPKIQRLWNLLLWKLLSAYSVCATVAQRILGRLIKFADMVGWAVLHRNLGSVIATFRAITKADLPRNLLSFTVGWAPSNQPGNFVIHLNTDTRVVGIFVPAAPKKLYDTITLIHVTVFREFYFDWHHSGFCNDNKDRLHSEMIITKGFKLLEIIDCIK